MYKSRPNFDPGFGLFELMVSLVSASVLMLGAYVFVTKQTRVTMEDSRISKSVLEAEKTMNRLADHIRNAVPLNSDSGATVLMNLPPRDSGCLGWPVASGILALPTITYQTIFENNPNVSDPFLPIDSSDSGQLLCNIGQPLEFHQDDQSPSDALRIAYITQDSLPAPLFMPDRLNFSLNNAGDNPITIDKRGSWEPGEFAIISEGGRTELFRITDTEELAGNRLEISHNVDVSIWNRKYFDENFGRASYEETPVVRKVSVETIVHDPNRQLLLVDDHLADDGWNENTKTFSGGKARVPYWKVAADHVTQFKVEYAVVDGNKDAYGKDIFIRKPRTNLPIPGDYLNDSNVNQVGFPNLKFVKVSITLEIPATEKGVRKMSKTIERVINPEGVKTSFTNSNAVLNASAPFDITGTPAISGGPCVGYCGGGI